MGQIAVRNSCAQLCCHPLSCRGSRCFRATPAAAEARVLGVGAGDNADAGGRVDRRHRTRVRPLAEAARPAAAADRLLQEAAPYGQSARR